MKLKAGIILLLLIAAINISAQTKSVSQKVNEEEAVSNESYPIDARPILERLEKKFATEISSALSKKTVNPTAWNFKVGDKYSWQSFDLRTGQNNLQYSVSSTCRAVGKNSYIFVEDSSWVDINKKVNQAVVDSVLYAFETKTPNSSQGIYNTNISTFGATSLTYDSKIIILIHNIRDDYKGSGGYVAGYFWAYAESKNNAHIYYLDSNPLPFLKTDGTIDLGGLYTGMGTTAHEFQHMIHYNYHPNQETFFNEAWSLVAEVVCGYGLYSQSGTQGYSNNTNRYLLNWNRNDATDVLKDYSRAARFSLYLYEQFGADILKKFLLSVKNGDEAFDYDVFPKLGTTRRFADVLADWFVANYVNDKSVDSKLGYTYSPLVTVNPLGVDIAGSAFFEDAIYKAAAKYISFTAGKNLTINFNSITASAIKVKAIKIGSSAPQVVDVAMNTNVNFSDFGTSYNKITFIIYHNEINSIASGPFTFTCTVSGTAVNVTQEIKYDATEPVGILTHTVGDTLAVHFDGVAGMKLDSIKVALRQAGSVSGGIYQFTGVSRPSPLGKKLAVPITVTSNIATRPGVPYPIPWSNWAKLDLRSKNIDATNSFVVAFTAGEYVANDATKDNRIMITEMLDMNEGYHSYTYLNKPSSGTPNWYYISSANGIYLYLIRAYVSNGITDVSEPIEIIPSSFTLSQNYPNPFNPSTVISYQLPKQSRVQIKIYDAIGNEIRSLIDEEKSAGKYNILWDSRNNYGTRVSSGVYFYKITADGFAQTKKMILMK
ncbi:MAG: FlgD immunoglobulin-like domain containing protein [Melioribacteraceae bacterium]